MTDFLSEMAKATRVRHLVVIAIVLLVAYSMYYVNVVQPLRHAAQVCELAQSINEECTSDREKCERDALPAFQKMLDVCRSVPTTD
jgi:hypothetical protein